MAAFSLLWSLIGGIRGIALIVAMLGIFATYDRYIDDPLVAANARKGFVLEAERDALMAQLEERKRQAAAAESAVAGLQYELNQQRFNNEAARDQLESEIKDYEAKLKSDGRFCTLSDEDIKWLTR